MQAISLVLISDNCRHQKIDKFSLRCKTHYKLSIHKSENLLVTDLDVV